MTMILEFHIESIFLPLPNPCTTSSRRNIEPRAATIDFAIKSPEKPPGGCSRH